MEFAHLYIWTSHIRSILGNTFIVIKLENSVDPYQTCL